MKTVASSESSNHLPVMRLFKEKRREWKLNLFSPKEESDKIITVSDLHRPGLAFAGFTEKFAHERIQIVGETEWHYLNSLKKKERQKVLDTFFGFPVPCIIISKSLVAHKEMEKSAFKTHTPIIGTSLSTTDITNSLSLYLKKRFSPRTTIHASLMDVYGIGILYTGKPGIGKSECCLDLVERGHQLVADDIVRITRDENRLVGSGNDLIEHHMEIRGLGIIDVQRLFGIRAIRKKKSINVAVELVKRTDGIDYERTGISEITTKILGIKIPKIVLPVSPGKNITVISEVVAMNTLLKSKGIYSARLFNKKLIRTMLNMKKNGRHF